MTNSKTTKKDATRVQSHADRTGTNQDFKARAQRAADRGERQQGAGNAEGKGKKQG